MAFGHGAKKKKGKKGKKGKKKEPKMPWEEVQKNLKNFLKLLTDACKKYETDPIASITKKLKSMSKSEDPVPLVFDVIAEPLATRQLHALLETLDSYPHYNTLKFWRAGLGDEGAVILGEWLRPNCHLKHLELLDNRIGVRGCASLSSALHHNECLTHLIMDYNDMGDEGASVLSVGVSWNPTLQVLSLKYCGIGAEGAETIATEVIGKSQSIVDLDLQGNPLSPKGVASIGKALKETKLQKLSLADTSFGQSVNAIRALADGIQANATLTDLNLHLNTLEPQGAEFLLNILKEQKTLSSLKLYEFQQKIPNELFKELLAAVAANKTTKGKKKGKKGKKGKKKKK
eukprot:CAMPEP_0117449266 /NCGR_PEP_ID=MMETSP0759-20121206/7855_1 /TAXON_ID=63605 /ORGANISM="Percolomonas cosmopolitus, Strain WS" /LENGTH=344 /DNA_ID=CAMNT_0005241733 /DNA_START=107 /DNA_END=1142 /DNA_ORIENTATION=+